MHRMKARTLLRQQTPLICGGWFSFAPLWGHGLSAYLSIFWSLSFWSLAGTLRNQPHRMHVGWVQHQVVPGMGARGGQQVQSAQLARFKRFPAAFE